MTLKESLKTNEIDAKCSIRDEHFAAISLEWRKYSIIMRERLEVHVDLLKMLN